MNKGPNLSAYNDLIRKLYAAGKVIIDRNHIEIDRAYRDIDANDVLKVLKTGRIVSIDAGSNAIFMRGKDLEGRELELICIPCDEDGERTLVIKEAVRCFVETAYEPGTKGEIDDETKAEWLKSNSVEWEDAGADGVKKK